jgi:hypothetical protein
MSDGFPHVALRPRFVRYPLAEVDNPKVATLLGDVQHRDGGLAALSDLYGRRKCEPGSVEGTGKDN